MINSYYILIDNEKTGPFTHDELMDMDITADSMVLSPLADDWQEASDLAEFHTYFTSRGIYFPTLDNVANFWWRVLAYVIDYLIILIAAVIFVVVLEVVLQLNRGYGFDYDALDKSPWVNILTFITMLTYNSFFEATSTQGSIGKLICGMVVVDANGNPINFGKALSRNLAKILSSLVCGIGFLCVLWDSHRQGWHDQLAKTYIVKKRATYTTKTLEA